MLAPASPANPEFTPRPIKEPASVLYGTWEGAVTCCHDAYYGEDAQDEKPSEGEDKSNTGIMKTEKKIETERVGTGEVFVACIQH